VRALITGSAGLVGSACARYLSANGFEVFGVDNNSRAKFFGLSSVERLGIHLDICERGDVDKMFYLSQPNLIVHCAAQPSHDLAARIPFEDFQTNAVGTLNMLEAARKYCPDSPFVFLSSNKVYGDMPNRLPRREIEKRWELGNTFHIRNPEGKIGEYADHTDHTSFEGIRENCPVDRSMHSLFGCSKLAADLLVQEYGRYFDMPTVCLRAGCLTGPGHAGVELHGFLSYLIKRNVEKLEYKVFGYKGKQVRDNLHADDVARFVLEFYRAPRKAAVYNIGGGKENSCSILEAFELAERYSGKKMKWTYVAEPRKGDHICYYSDLRLIKADYPGWSVTRDLPSIFEEMVKARMECGR
jgi:CDP-paratose 2-epimerase